MVGGSILSQGGVFGSNPYIIGGGYGGGMNTGGYGVLGGLI
jgi:hypothetical protein